MQLIPSSWRISFPNAIDNTKRAGPTQSAEQVISQLVVKEV